MVQSISPRAPLGIPDGGTGASSQLGALVSLGVPLGTVEEVVAGAGLAGGGAGTSVELRVGVVQLPQGGTGATTQANARNALGAAPVASPSFTGVPRATGAVPILTENSDRIATTAWVTAKLTTYTAGVDGGVF